MIVVLAEKPSVARDLAAVLGAKSRKEGYLEGNGYQITWAFGHLVTLKEPDEVAQAVLHLMSSDNPKRRYMVTPNANQAATTIRLTMARMLELNEDQPYSYSRDELVEMLDAALAGPAEEEAE